MRGQGGSLPIISAAQAVDGDPPPPSLLHGIYEHPLSSFPRRHSSVLTCDALTSVALHLRQNFTSQQRGIPPVPDTDQDILSRMVSQTFMLALLAGLATAMPVMQPKSMTPVFVPFLDEDC